MQKFFEGNLFSKVQHLVLHGYHFKLNDDHFEKFLSLDIAQITINNIDLTSVSDDLFAKLVNSCKECEIGLNWTQPFLEANKWITIFDVMRKETKLKSLILHCEDQGFIYLPHVPTEILAQAFNRLESVSLTRVQFGENQLKTICLALTGSSNMKYLDLQELDPESDFVAMDMLDAVLTNLRGFSYKPSLLNNPAERLMELANNSCKLKSLDLENFNLKEVPPKLLARVFNKLECLDLLAVTMSEEQTKEVFRVMSSRTCLKKFVTNQQSNHMSLEFIDHIEKVDPLILAKALNNIEFLKVDFPPPITLPQILAIFKQLNKQTMIKAILREPPGENETDLHDDEILYL